MKEKLSQYKHILLLLYFPFYLAAFYYLEKITPDKIHIIDCTLDRYIPFMEVFIVPYLLWFLYLGVVGFYFFFYEKESFCKMMYFGIIGMTAFLFVSYLYPNGLELRPDHFVRDNIFIRITQYIYQIDTATNVLPSIHVFNSVGACISVYYSESLKKKPWIQKGSFVLSVLIILSTVFVKQHSLVDVMTALVMSCVVFEFIYNDRMLKIRNGLEELKYRKKAGQRSVMGNKF